MSDFRIRFLGLAAVATAFAGMSYGQVSCGAGTTQTISPGSPILDRAESQTELVSDVVINCVGSNLVTNGQLTVFSSLPVTSKAIGGLATGNSEAVLRVTAGGVTSVYNGTVSGSVVSFTGIIFPTSFVAQISNIRVNASSAGAGTSPVPVTESVFAGSNGLATLVYNNIIVGYVLKSLAAPAFTLNSLGFPAITNYNVCTGNPVAPIAGFGAPSLSFSVIAAETFGGAFKLQTDPAGIATNQEQGSYVSGSIGTATTATQISLTFGNVPSGATIYVPLSVSQGTLTLTLTGSPTVATTPAGLTLSGGGPSIAAPSGPVAFTPSGGTVTATYAVTATSAASLESVAIPVYVSFAANSAPAQGPITVLEAYSPSAATLTGPATAVPTFATPTNTPLNGSIISLCQTTLIFPFITNSSGFETGIAIANTTTDNLGPLGSSIAVPTNGTCTINFYTGTGTQPTAFTTPVIGVSTTTVPTSGSVYANTITTMTGTSGLTGYAIAQCSFLQAHGFGYVVNGFDTPSGTADAYLAIVVPNTRNEQVANFAINDQF